MQATTVTNFYDLLEVNRTSTQAEIKRAYFKKIRQFPNETHPEEFQQISKAYKVLMDADAKASYDREIMDNGAYSRLMQQALDSMGNENYNSAIYTLEEMLKQYPNDQTVRKNMALCYLNLDRYEESKRILYLLENENPNDEDTLYLLAQVFQSQKVYQQAVHYYERLIVLAPGESNYYLRLSSAYCQLNNYDQACRVLEEKLKQGKESVHDYPLLEELFFITMIADNQMYHQKVITRIKKLYSNSTEKKQLLGMLIELCDNLSNENNGYKELVRLVRDINNNEFYDVNDWLGSAESRVRQDLIYYGDPKPTNQGTSYPSNSTSSQPVTEDDGRGSVGFSILLGIVLSFIATPIVGIIAGFVWYFKARAIKNLLSGIGCLVAIIVVVGFILSNL
ncbi:tetratricopeptide repeat protein [Bacillus timonensis]|uniref:Tetratricopeptide repeat protein n=1 Tax=Bacillus timonensis TaxID=1033734 RepID=A0A4S3PRN5_9BACI|nr:tetratricopeptide repeat protein [Bacillus timonensis]THE11945.1 tetratricopeptide repeat protein [Bacillus timonensis]